MSPKTPFGTPIEIPPPAKKERVAPGKRGFGLEIDPSQAPPKKQSATQTKRSFGLEVDPAQAPPKRERPAPSFAPKPIQPIDVAPPSSTLMTFKTVALGLMENVPAPNLPAGATPEAQNVLAREGVLEPRYRLAKVGSGSSLCDDVLAMGEMVNTAGTRYPFAISAATMSYYSGSVWTFGSYFANGVNDPPSAADTVYIDAVQIYEPVSDDNAIAWVNGTDQCFVASGYTKGFSSLTNAPIAKTIAVFDNRVVWGNITSGGTTYPQRIQYSEKWNPSITTAPTGGFEDETDARGALLRLISDGDRVLAYFEHELWYGYAVDYPFNLTFLPLDRSTGCSGAWAVCQTPKGVFHLGSDYMPYITPRGGLPQAVGQAVWKTLREDIDYPTRAHAEYNPQTGEVVLCYAHQGGTGRPKRALTFDINTGVWTPQTFDVAITRLGVGDYTSSSVTWGGLVGTWAQQTKTWSQLGGTASARVLYAGTSTGTIAAFTSDATNDLGTAVETKYLAVVPNEDPARKMYVREVRLDYRAASASSLTLKMSGDFGTTWQSEVGVALPTAPTSAQTTVWVGAEAIYPTILFQHDQGHRFAIQRAIAVVTPTGRG